jgi:hypothetical protein
VISSQPLQQKGLDPRVCNGFSSVWVENRVDLVLVWLKIVLNGFRWGWAERDIRAGLVEVWLGF